MRLIPLSLALVAALAACGDAPTTPTTRAGRAVPAPSATLQSAAAFTVDYASCTFASNQLKCSYEITNPHNQMLDIYVEGRFAIAYECVNPSTGRVQDSGTVSAKSFTFGKSDMLQIFGTDVVVGLPDLPGPYAGSQKKYNPCKGTSVPNVLGYTLQYWDVYAEVPNTFPLQWSCFASDDHAGCTTQ